MIKATTKFDVIRQTLQNICGAHHASLLLVWDIFSFAVLGLNSFILLLHDLVYVICAGAVAYVFVMIGQTCFLFKQKRRRRILLVTKKLFRLVYTLIYLTAIMLDILILAEAPGNELALAYNGCLFIWILLWGTNFLWIPQLFRLFDPRKFRKSKPESPPSTDT